MGLTEEFARACALEQPPAGPVHVHNEGPQFQLHHLDFDALATIFQHLSVKDIHNALQASQGLHEALQDERVWHGLCLRTWGASTDPHRWLPTRPAAPLPGTPTRVNLPPPQTYRKLYMLLHETAPIVGLWRLMGEGPRSALISFRWGRDGIEGAELDCHTPLSGRVDATSWARICPARGLNTAVWVEADGWHASVTVYGAAGQRLHKSPSAEAAAAVAIAGATSARSCPLGSSPQGSFEHEWLEFMSGNVVGSRARQRRRSQRSLGQGRGEGPAVYHLKRLAPAAPPSSKHPHSGLWAADYGPQGLEVLQLHYDFKGKAASLHATKVTGDDCVPAGQCSWQAAAAPLPAPWPEAVQALVQQQEERWLAEREWWEDDSSNDDNDRGSTPTAAAGGSGGGGHGSGGKRPPQVVAVHQGSGRVAGPGFTDPQWVAGRLLAFADGSLSFVWLEGLGHVTEMRRLRITTA